jgi:DNA polymerase-3 subunit alpha
LKFEASTLDGVNRLDSTPQHIKNKGMSSCALTDHGNCVGHYQFWQNCNKVGIKPILGLEAYISVLPNGVREPDERERAYYHMVMLALNNKGLHNLWTLSSRAYTENLYYKPRIAKQIMADYSEGIAATTACLGSLFSQLILRGDYKQAEKQLLEHADIYKDRFFVELQAHAGDQQVVNSILIELANRNSLPIIMTADAHYTHKHDKQFHETTLKMATEGSGDGFSFGDIEVFLGSPQEMQDLAKQASVPLEALTNTTHIANMVTNDYFSDRKNRFTKYKECPPGIHSWQVLEAEAISGLQKRFTTMPFVYTERLFYELGVIKKLGFSDYFLIVAQYVNKARELDIAIGPGRGSAGGSLVAYALGITKVDPIKYNLLFERMLNPGRAALPLIFDQATKAIAQQELDRLESEHTPAELHDHCSLDVQK